MYPILVTGAAQGLGKECALELARRGHDLLIHYNHSEHEARVLLEEVKECGVKGDLLQADFTKPSDLVRCLQLLESDFPEIKGIVHNVGNYLNTPLHETTVEQWRELFEANFFAPLTLTQALIPYLARQKGRIVTIGVAGLSTLKPQQTAYFATKSTLLYYTQALAKAVASDGITVNMVSPGFMENSVGLEKANLPMHRPATLREVAHVVSFLFEEQNGYLTGQNIEVAGALTL